MSKMALKSIRLIAAISILFISLAWWNNARAAVGELDIDFSYPLRFVSPLKLTEFPGGISAFKKDSYLFAFTRAKQSWSVEILSETDYVLITLQAGNFNLYNPIAIERDSYIYYFSRKKLFDAWIYDMANFSGTKGKGERGGGVEVRLDFVKMPKPVESIIGEGGPRITVTGSRKISFSGRSEWNDELENTGTFKQSKFPSLHMEQTSRFKIRGEIGSKIHIEVDQDSNRDVDLANTLKLRYTGEEDEIVKTIEAGNTSLSLPNAQLIGYSQNIQGLFGIKATAQLGNIELTMITSQEKGSSEKSSFKSGAKPEDETIWDYQYLHNVYFDLGKNFTPADSLIDVKLFKLGDNRDRYGYACVTPHFGPEPGDTGSLDTLYYTTPEQQERGEFVENYFVLLEETDYEYNALSYRWYVILRQPLDDLNGVLGAYIKYSHRVSDDSVEIRQIGNIAGTDTLVLKLIRDNEVEPGFETWDLEWRNVYDLRSRNISPDGFELQIYKGNGNIEIDTLAQDSIPYIEVFGFDMYNNSNLADRTPDGLFDFDASRDIDALRGHLIFHTGEPFRNDMLRGGTPDLITPNDAVYDYRYSSNERRDAKTYYIYVKTATRANTFTLGRTNIIESSEVVKLSDGTILKRGVDYTIIYEIGQITFISDEAMNLASDVAVDFEYAPFFMPEKKSLFGLAAKYAINDKSSVSFAGMIRSESTREYRPRVGREPRRAMIWDSNFIFHFNPSFITSAVDALPFIETDAQSMVEISGEVAQSFPNPNTRGEAYIDDFEGTKEYNDLVMRRGIWTVASPPDWDNTNLADTSAQRKMWWYNPYDPFLITNIWPERADFREHENRHDVLVLEYFPEPDSNGVDTIGWAGIMRPMYAGLSDQSRTKFIEVWYLPDNEDVSGNPTLYIDAGKITEDINGNGGLPDTEDKNNNGVFEEGEDCGLDTLNNEQERVFYNSEEADPSGDDWYYNSQGDERYDYSRINGTEGNRNDPDRLNRFDTEDINNNKSLDRTNSYFQYKIDLNDPAFLEDETSTGWRLLRIPFQDSSAYEAVNNPDFENINFIKVWIAGASREYKLHFASIQLVGNKWLELDPPPPVYIHGMPMDTKFEVTVLNSQEHSGIYESPPGVHGEYQQDTGIQEKEQSLVLRYENLYPGQRVGAYWPLLSTEDYTFYNKMKMFVHGDENLPESVPLYFFFRVGADSTQNYYEYKVRLSPGWAENNHVEIDFAEITALKSYRLSGLAGNDEDSATAESIIETTNYNVKGSPSLSQVRFFSMGIEYDNLTIDGLPAPMVPISGDVWCDELYLTEVRRKSDFAGRVTTKVSLADLGNITANYSRTGADFFPLSAKKPTGSLSTFQSITGRFNIDKFFPPSWGMSLPLSLSWQKNLQLPRLKTGSDIILPEEQRLEEKTENRQWSVSTSERFTRKTNNWLWNLTLKRIDTRYVYTRKYGTNPTTPVSRTTSYEVAGKYDLSPGKKPFFKPFRWCKKLFLPQSICDVNFYFLPTVLRFDSKLNSNNTYSARRGARPTSSYVRDLALNQTYEISVFSALKTNFSSSTNRDISDPKTVNFSFDPRKIKLGRERSYNQTFSSTFNPSITRDLKPRFQFTAKYADNSDLARNPDSTRSTQLNANLRGDLTLDIVKVFGIAKLLGGKKAGGSQFKPPGRPEDRGKKGEDENGKKDEKDEEGEEAGEEEKSKTSKGIPNPLIVLKKTLYVFNSIKPIQGSFSTDKKLNRSGLYDRPDWKYTLGFVDNHGVRQKDSTGFQTSSQTTLSKDYSLRSGLTPIRNLDITTSYKIRLSVSRASNIPTKTKSVDFPSLDVTISGVEKFPLFKKIVKSANLQSAYAQKIDETGNADTKVLNERSINKSFIPLLGLNLTFNKGIRGTVRYEQTNRKRENLRQEGSNQRVDYSQDNSFNASVNYSLTAPKGLNIPLLGKVKFDSQLTLTLDYLKKFRKSWYFLEGNKSVDVNNVETSVTPKVSYRFSAKITGGLSARWIDSNDKIQKRKRHVRELEIWTELRF